MSDSLWPHGLWHTRLPCPSHQVAWVLELQHQAFQWIFRIDFFKDWLVWSPCCPRNSWESSPAPQFESINSLALSILYGLTSVHDYWKDHVCVCVCVCVCVRARTRTCTRASSVMSDSETPCTVAHQALLSMGFSRQEHTGVGCHSLLQGIFLT